MNEDSVLREVRAAREAYARAHDFDVRKIVAELRVLDQRGDCTVVRLAPRRPRIVGVKSVGPNGGKSAGESESVASSRDAAAGE